MMSSREDIPGYINNNKLDFRARCPSAIENTIHNEGKARSIGNLL